MADSSFRVDLREHPHHSPPSVRPHRQEVDDVGPVLAVLVAVAHQAGRDCVAVSVVVDQDASKVVAGLWVEGLQQRPKMVVVGHVRGRLANRPEMRS